MAQKLWSKDTAPNTPLAAKVAQFTIGNDTQFDALLAEHDLVGTQAHAQMLAAVGLLTPQEHQAIHDALADLLAQVRQESFEIEAGVEDIHSQIELLLTHKIGEAGKKIHTGRSRNDQVLLAIKLYLRHEIQQIAKDCTALFEVLIALSEQYRDALLPGYTHFQAAMPSSFGLWFGAYAEALTDDLEMLAAAYQVCDKNPLGSAAGYGSSFPLNRQLTTTLLGMHTLNYNSVYAQMTRGKTEKIVAMALACVGGTLSKLAYDVCWYMSQDLGFVRFPDALTTGSSIMPHKKNPDIFELIRAKANQIQALPNALTMLTSNLPSGYHRDYQLTKEMLFPAIQTLKDCLEMACVALPYISITPEILQADKYRYVFSVEVVNKLVRAGKSFREAYQEVGRAIEQGDFSYNSQTLHHTHEGSLGNLCLPEIRANFEAVRAKIPPLYTKERLES